MLNSQLKPPLQVQKTTPDVMVTQNTDSDIKFQNITYYMNNGSKTVESKDMVSIDFLKASHEMDNIDWKCDGNYIGFINHRTDETVQFVRLEHDEWYAEILITDGQIGVAMFGAVILTLKQ